MASTWLFLVALNVRSKLDSHGVSLEATCLELLELSRGHFDSLVKKNFFDSSISAIQFIYLKKTLFLKKFYS